MTKEQAKEKIQKLIERYQQLSAQEIKTMNEENTKNKFIRPLFETLGWDFEEDVLLEDHVSNGRVDYNFQINGKTKFFLEAKPLKADIDDLGHAKQTTNYAWLKNVNWAVLCDFEGIRVFYPAERGQAKAFLRLDYKNYISSLDDLWLLSKESFKQNLIEAQAEKWGIKPEQIKVSDQLSEDMSAWRQNLYENFQTWNPKLTDSQLDDGVQKILDRFIFIRSAEDRGLENNSLRSEYRIWEEKGRKGNFLAYLKPIFAEYKKNYNSGLFDDHLCMEWEVESESFAEIINGLYKSKNGQEYDFSIIDADVLGGVYEQYLGHLLSKADDGDVSKKKRKSQGIYYTPSFIVDYIVQNTLGKVLEEKSQEEIANLKILDPACGSGSFLIKAFDYLASHQVQKEKDKKFDLKTKLGRLEKAFRNRDGVKTLSTTDKMEILRNNIYGVDLDQQAVEIAQLNLMLKTLDRKQELPHLNNIRCGNSLIDDPKIAGDRAFNWNEQFSEVMRNGGFDIIIGNPPYVNLANIKEPDVRNFLQKNYKTAKNKSDLYSFFVEKALLLLKDNGTLGFIVSDSWLSTDSFSEFRKFLVNNAVIYELTKLPLGTFKNAIVTPVLIFLKKGKTSRDNRINLTEFENNEFTKISNYLTYDSVINSPNYNFSFDSQINFKISTLKLGKIAKFSLGIKTSDDKKFIFDKKTDSTCYKLLRGKDAYRYGYKYANKYIWYRPELMMKKVGAGPRKLEYFLKPKLFIKDIASEISATFDENDYLSTDTLSLIYDTAGGYNLKYILSLLNSKLINKWYLINFSSGLHIKINELQEIPVPIINLNSPKEKIKHDNLVKMVDQILKLNKELQMVEKGSNRWNQISSEIQKTDKLIDQKVYELYGLNKKEIQIIEDKK